MTDFANSSSILGFEGVPHFYLVKSASQDQETLEKCEKLIKDNWNTKTELKWLNTAECLKLDAEAITKTDVFVFPEFKGPAFDALRSRGKALLLGPPALRKCLVEQETIPLAPPPWIFNTAMNGLVITLSGLREADKKKYLDLISFMGGLCMPSLPESATHLVSNTVFSAKYEAAQQLNIPVMDVQWIEEVWKQNATDFVSATSPQFDQYKLPVFYNLNVACTLLSNDEKAMVERLVTGNGGIFHRTFKTHVVNILVVKENGKSSDKFKAACKHRKVCLLPKWISDSVGEGYALPFSGYEVGGEVRVSTPNKDADQNPEFSVSHIQGSSANSTVNESLISVRSATVLGDYYQVQVSTPPPRVPNVDAGISNDYYKECMKNLNVTKAKKAGSFLDGCNVFFSGFTAVEMGKLNKIISLSGATRYEELNENVTHVVVGKRDDKELKAFQDMNKEVHFVKFDWLQESMRAGHAANEDDHCYELTVAANKTVLMEQPSPASKRNIAAMNSSFKRPFPKNDQMAELSKNAAPTPADAAQAEDGFLITRRNLVSRYLQSTAENMDIVDIGAAGKSKDKDNGPRERQTVGSRVDQSRLMHSTFGSELESDQIEQLDFFCGKKFSVQGIDNDQDHMQVLADIQNFGGTIVERSYKGEVDFLVTPPEMAANFKPQHKAKEIVSHWWVEDVISSRADVPVCYYHRLIEAPADDGQMLRGTVCVISSYAGAERLFLIRIAQTMGATTEDKYVKKKHPILICDKAEGSKYKGAVTWGFPVVTKEWLLETYDKRHLQKLEDYLVGESKISEATHVAINERGIRRGAEPLDDDSSMIQLRTESPLLSQVPPSPMVGLLSHKRKSDDADTFVRNTEKKLRLHDNLVLLPANHGTAANVNNRVKALRSESKPSGSPTTPISTHVREMGQEFGYDTPHRTQLYDVLKEMENVTPRTPHTPEAMKMPALRLHPDPEATPSRQWDVLHKFSGFLSREERANELKAGGRGLQKKKQAAPATPLSEIKRRFWKETLGEDFPYENNSTMLNINSQQLEVQPRRSVDVTTMEDQQEEQEEVVAAEGEVDGGSTVQLQGLVDLIKRRKSEPKKAMGNLETCPVECGTEGLHAKEVDNEIMVGWADPNEGVVPFRTPPLASRSGATIRPPPYFLLSGLVANAATLNMVQELGGDMQKVKSSEYEAQCTHIVCVKPGRVEKVLCAVAAGKWIVSLKYIEDSYKAKEFLDEERYEWANPKCEHPMERPSDVDNQVAQAAYAWRLRIQDKTSQQYRTGAFHGFRVLLWAKTAGFRKIITAGGGVCLDVGSTYRESAEVARTATHCFLEKKVPFPPDNHLFCKEIGIRITDILSLNEYLLNENLSACTPSRTGGDGGGSKT